MVLDFVASRLEEEGYGELAEVRGGVGRRERTHWEALRLTWRHITMLGLRSSVYCKSKEEV